MNSKNTSLLKYFSYFRNIAGWHMYGYILVNLLVGLLDGLGLAMFIPLLGIASGINTNTSDENSDVINFIVNLFDFVGVNVNLVNALLFMVIVFSIKGVFYYLRSVYFIKIRVKSVSLLRLNLIKNLNELSYSGFTKLEAGRIQNTMVGELGKVIGALMSFFVYLQHIIMLATYIFLAFIANWQFAILVAIGGSLSNLFYKYINSYTKEKATLLSSKGNSFNAVLIQILHNFKYLKATNHYRLFSKKLVDNIGEQEKINLGVGKISSIGESLREPFTIVIITGVIIVQTSYLGESFSSILLSLLLFYRALGHLVSMQNSWNTFLSNSSGIDSFETLLSDFKHYKEPLHYQEKIEHIDDINIKNISLSFRGKKAIDNISFSIKKNSSVAFVGESGAGKTTTIGKLASQFTKKGLKVVLGAADTFRAAAIDQLQVWADRTGVPMIKQQLGSDPASVAYDTLTSAVKQGADVVIIDTAGRLHNKINLMNELSKIKRVMQKVVPDAPHEVLLVLDGSTGQNAFEQAKEFTKATEVTALAVTKLDGTAKGGVVIGISDQFQIPVKYIGVGEGIDDLQIFNKYEFVDSFFQQ